MKNTIFLDFDGVLRHWAGTDVRATETSLGLKPGTLFSIAFSSELLIPAITGNVSDEQWRTNARTALEKNHGNEVAAALMLAWENAANTIDWNLLKEIEVNFPSIKLVLATNATTRLDADLGQAELKGSFFAIANSSSIGFAKPSAEFFQAALTVANCTASEAIFIDDSQENIDAAKRLGISSELYTTSRRALEFIGSECA